MIGRCLIILLGAAFLISCATPYVDPKPVDLKSKPAIWKIEDENSKLWIFGSFHVLPADLDWRPAEINAALNSVDTIWFETDLSPSGFAETGTALASAGQGEGDLLSRLPNSISQALTSLASDMGIPVSSFDNATIWYAALTVVQLSSVRNGDDPASGVELTLAREAVERGLRIRGFESAEEHVRLFTELSKEAQLSMLSGALASPPGLLDDMRVAWMAQDFAALERFGNESFGDLHPELGEALVYDRNKRWVEAIFDRINGEGRDLVVIGAIHTVGDDGIISLLKNKGLKVSGPSVDILSAEGEAQQ